MCEISGTAASRIQIDPEKGYWSYNLVTQPRGNLKPAVWFCWCQANVIARVISNILQSCISTYYTTLCTLCFFWTGHPNLVKSKLIIELKSNWNQFGSMVDTLLLLLNNKFANILWSLFMKTKWHFWEFYPYCSQIMTPPSVKKVSNLIELVNKNSLNYEEKNRILK